MHAPPPSLIAALAPAYRVERELGRGATAIVFLGEDLKHHRRVAIKVLRAELVENLGNERFLREIVLAAGLAHPHIVPLLDSGERDGYLYYVMPAIEGETLRERLMREGRLPVADALRIGTQLADALSYAHEQGVVHRDVKPENVLLSRSGHALMVDFGIARAIDASTGEHSIQTGFALGTPAYMSPEQVSGAGEGDTRSDQYSLAVTCFEMLTGETPFAGPTLQASLMRRLSEPPPSVRERRAEVGAEQDEALRRAMSLRAEDRFGTASEFMAALLRSPALATTSGTVAPRTPVIAVLPLKNLSSDPENQYLADGIAEEILSALSQVKGMRVAGRASSFAFRGDNVDLHEISEALGVTEVLSGSMRRAGSRLRVSAELVHTSNGQVAWSNHYDRELTDIFAIQDEIAASVSESLQLVLAPPTTRPMHTANLAAHELFLRGRSLYLIGPARYAEARSVIEQGLALDPASAFGQSLLAGFFAITGVFGMAPPHDVFPRAKAMVRKVLEGGPEAFALSVEGLAAFFYDWDVSRARRVLGESLRLSGRARALYALVLAAAGETDRAAEQIAQACVEDPFDLNNRFQHVDVLRLLRRPEEALDEARRVHELFPESSQVHYQLANLLFLRGQADEALPWAERSSQGRNILGTATLVEILAATGRVAEARAILDAALARSQTAWVSPVNLARMQLAVGDRDAAFAQLERAIEQRDSFVVVLRRHPIFDPFRDDPRADAVLRKAGV